MKLTILYSLEHDVSRITWVIQKLKWYQENEYRPVFPTGVTITNAGALSKTEISELVKKEYDSNYYQKAKDELQSKADEYLPSFVENISKLPVHVQEAYDVTLTKYGTGGSYHPPNKVILNIKGKFEIGPIKTVMHEITHLSIHHLIDEYKISHWKKERVVDLLMTKLASRFTPRFQNVPIDTAPVDKIFNDYYPDIPEIIKRLG